MAEITDTIKIEFIQRTNQLAYVCTELDPAAVLAILNNAITAENVEWQVARTIGPNPCPCPAGPPGQKHILFACLPVYLN